MLQEKLELEVQECLCRTWTLKLCNGSNCRTPRLRRPPQKWIRRLQSRQPSLPIRSHRIQKRKSNQNRSQDRLPNINRKTFLAKTEFQIRLLGTRHRTRNYLRA